MKLRLPANVTRKFYKAGLRLRKASPTILVVGGCITGVVATVSACKATLKARDVIEENKAERDATMEAKERLEAGETVIKADGTKYTEDDLVHDIKACNSNAAIRIVRLYAPSVLLGIMSIGSILGGHHIICKRNVALAAAYTGTNEAFKKYRQSVIERFGEDLDKELRYNIKTQEVESVTVDEETGEKIVKKELADVCDPSVLYSEYSRVYDDGCTGWTKDPAANLRQLMLLQNIATEKLERQGYLFLNDVYGMLNLPKSKAGRVVGWIYDKENPIGDNCVDFNIFNIVNPKNRDFVNGYEKNIVLDFNVDGNIMDLIKDWH